MRAALALLAACLGAGALAEPANRVTILKFEGLIHVSQVPKVREAIARADPGAFPAGLIVLLDSQGGDGLAAIEIGRMLREAQAHVFVTGRCASACTYVLAGGVVRSARAYTVGVHRGRIAQRTPDGKLALVDRGLDEKLQAFYREAERKTREHFADMGLPEAVFETMQAVPGTRIRWLSREEAEALELVGHDPQWMRSRAIDLERLRNVPPADYMARTHSAQRACGPEAQAPEGFAECYRRHLLGEQPAERLVTR